MTWLWWVAVALWAIVFSFLMPLLRWFYYWSSRHAIVAQRDAIYTKRGFAAYKRRIKMGLEP